MDNLVFPIEIIIKILDYTDFEIINIISILNDKKLIIIIKYVQFLSPRTRNKLYNYVSLNYYDRHNKIEELKMSAKNIYGTHGNWTKNTILAHIRLYEYILTSSYSVQIGKKSNSKKKATIRCFELIKFKCNAKYMTVLMGESHDYIFTIGIEYNGYLVISIDYVKDDENKRIFTDPGDIIYLIKYVQYKYNINLRLVYSHIEYPHEEPFSLTLRVKHKLTKKEIEKIHTHLNTLINTK